MTIRRTATAVLAASAALLGACQNPPPRGTVEAPPATATQPVVSDPVQDALRQLNSTNPNQRANALLEVVSALHHNAAEVAYVSRIAELIQLNVAAQLRELAQVDDPEARLRLGQVLAFNEALSRFAIDMLALPPAERQSMLAWGLDPQNVTLVGRCWSRDPDTRVQAVRDLAARTEPQAERLLVQLLEDPDSSVAVPALEAAADRPPTEALVAVIWRRGIEYPMRSMGLNYGFDLNVGDRSPRRVAQPQTRTVYIRGRAIQVSSPAENYYRGALDASVATEVLVNYKSPLVEARLNRLFVALTDSTNDRYGYRVRVLSPNYGNMSVSLMRLVDAYRPKAFVPCLMVMATGTGSDAYTQMINNQSYRMSSRIDALGMLVKFTRQDTEGYGLGQNRMFGTRWAIAGDEKQEDAAFKKLRAWWAAHYKEYGVKDPKLPEGGAIQGGGFGLNQGDGIE
jgi:hypothetical protein